MTVQGPASAIMSGNMEIPCDSGCVLMLFVLAYVSAHGPGGHC